MAALARILALSCLAASVSGCPPGSAPSPLEIGRRHAANESGARSDAAVGAAPSPSSAAPALQIAPGGAPGLAPRLTDDRTRPERQWDHIASSAEPDCREALTKTGAKFTALPDVPKPNAKGCGIPHGVLLQRGPTGIQYSPPLSIDCSLALRLVDIEAVIQDEAGAVLGSPIVRISTLGSYACRGVVGRLRGWTGGISEHSFGNAVDLASFQPKEGRAANVLRMFEPDPDEPSTKQGRFLHGIARRLRREASVRVLGPWFDASHRDHLHQDAGSPSWR